MRAGASMRMIKQPAAAPAARRKPVPGGRTRKPVQGATRKSPSVKDQRKPSAWLNRIIILAGAAVVLAAAKSRLRCNVI